MVSGCSTMLVAWLMTPGSSTASRGGLTDSNTWYTCSCRGLAASKENAPARIVNSVSTYSASGASCTRGPSLMP